MLDWREPKRTFNTNLRMRCLLENENKELTARGKETQGTSTALHVAVIIGEFE